MNTPKLRFSVAMCADLNSSRSPPALQQGVLLLKPISHLIEARRVAKMLTEGIKKVSPRYSAWFGKSVVLLVAIRQCHIPLPCSIIGESVADVRVRIEPGWEMDLRKELIVAVEE